MVIRHSAVKAAIISAALATSALAAGSAHAQTVQTVTPTAPRAVAPMSSVEPSWRRIRTFGGDVHPEWRRIRTFGPTTLIPTQAQLENFWGRNHVSLGADFNRIFAFQNDIVGQWRRIRTFWGDLPAFTSAPDEYVALRNDLRALVDYSRSTFGSAYEQETQQDFLSGFANPLLHRFGIDINDPKSLESLDEYSREEFFVTWFDNLMQYSGADQIDHWMGSVRWNPELTRLMGTGRDARIGILDFTLTGQESTNVSVTNGVSSYTNGHGSAVASLIVAPHDRRGVMGLAPAATVVHYNPFDASGTADWTDIINGVVHLQRTHTTSVINASLGVPGWTLHQGWHTVFSNAAVKEGADKTIFVIAAGNEGVTQSGNINWDFRQNPPFIVVGSVNPDHVISSFSNRPGTTCLVQDGVCSAGNRLMDRFLVAPGEFMLVSDGAGGVTRASGTSFSAPLVSGTIALIHDRWPWLVRHPKDVVNVLFRSAIDLGASGTDPVYGRGMLNVLGALSPLNLNQMHRWQQNTNGTMTTTTASTVLKTPSGTRATWEANSVYFVVFEHLGQSQRDFAIPLSSRLLNRTYTSGGSQEQFSTYLTGRFWDWFNSGGRSGFQMSDDGTLRSELASFGPLQASMSLTPNLRRSGFRGDDNPYDAAFQFQTPNGSWTFQAGTGHSAVALGGRTGFAMSSDYDPAVGGANPFLGFASGGTFAQARAALGPKIDIAAGFAEQSLERDLQNMPEEQRSYFELFSPYRATANHISVDYQPTAGLQLAASYTRLREDNAVLGMQSLEPRDFSGGSRTDAATIAANLKVSPRLQLLASATLGRSRTPGDHHQEINIGNGGMISSSMQFGVAAGGLLTKRDRARVTLSQPMHVESGTLELTQVRVIDRQTGEIGAATDVFELPSGERRLVADVLYATPVLDNAGELSLFGRAQLRGEAAADEAAVLAGARLRLSF